MNRVANLMARLQELAPTEFSLDDNDYEIEYRWYHGYETFIIKMNDRIIYEFRGAYHPNGHCEGGGVCKWCGMTLLQEDWDKAAREQ